MPWKLCESIEQGVKVADPIQTVPVDGVAVRPEVPSAVPVSERLFGDAEDPGSVADLKKIPPRDERGRHTRTLPNLTKHWNHEDTVGPRATLAAPASVSRS